MKFVVTCLGILFLSSLCFADDAIDRLERDYTQQRLKGTLLLHQRQLGEVEAVKTAALDKKDLALANKATARLKVLEAEIRQLESELESASSFDSKYPENEFFRMTEASEKLGTEHGRKIICKFSRKPLNDFAGEKLTLVVSAGSGKDNETSHMVYVINNLGGDTVGKTSGIPRGRSKEIELTMPPSETMELAIMVQGGDALHLKQFSPNVPEVYLKISK